ncbi:MAG: hypothetical protein P8Z81_08805 [Deinococcales bacterium]
MIRILDAQPSLFDASRGGSRLVERRLSSGVTVQLRLEPLPGERVRVTEYRRRAKDAARWKRRREEEGRTCAFEALALELPFEALFDRL